MKNYKGKLSYIFSSYKDINKNDLDLILKSGLKKIKLEMNDFNFIFSPYLFNEKTFEINDPIDNNKAYLSKSKDNFYKNYIYSYKNYTKNISLIGGINNLIPLFEFLNILNQNNKQQKNINLQVSILDSLINLIENIQNKSKKNSCHINYTKFYKYISLYIENLEKEIILGSIFFNTIIRMSEEKSIIENSSFFSSIFFNFKIINNYSSKDKKQFYKKILELISKNEKVQNNKKKENMFLSLLFKNWNIDEIFFQISKYKETPEEINTFIKEIYKRNKNDYCLSFLFQLISSNKVNDSIINFSIEEGNNENMKVEDLKTIVKNKFDETIISLLNRNDNIKFEIFRIVKKITFKLYKEIEQNKSTKLTNFLLNNFRIENFPNEMVNEGKNLIKNKLDNIYNYYFYEWLNILFRFIFIGFVDLDKIEKISLIDSYKSYDDNFFYGVIYLIKEYNDNLYKYIISLDPEKIYNIMKNQLNKMMIYIYVLDKNFQNCIFENTINSYKKKVLKIISHILIQYKENIIDYITNLLFNSCEFQLYENNYYIVFNNKYPINYIIDLIKETNEKIEEEICKKNQINNIQQKFNDYINKCKEILNKIQFNHGFPIQDIKTVIDFFFSEDKKDNLIEKSLNIDKTFDSKFFDFFNNYFLYHFFKNDIKNDNYQTIIIISTFIFLTNKNNDEIKEKFLCFLKILYFYEKLNQQEQFVFDWLKLLIDKSKHKKNQINENTLLYQFNELIKKYSSDSMMNETEIDIKNIIKTIIEKEIKKEILEFPKSEEIIKKEFDFKNENISKKIFEIQLKNQIKTFSKLKFYKKIKYDLFTWNGAYSEKKLFFNQNKDNKLKIYYKKSNHLTKEKISPLIIPMVYDDEFNKYYNVFSEKNEKVYIIPYPTIKIEDINIEIKKLCDNYYSCCLLIISNHFKGIFVLEKDFLQFIEINDENKKCYGDLLPNNKKNKYLKIYYNEINYIFPRNYYDQPNSIEIFSSRNKSYFFIFDKINDRNKIYEKLIETIKKNLEIKDIEKKWNENQISTLEYLMWVNIFGNRSLRDINQYPVFPWIITNYITSFEFSEEEKTYNEIIEKIKKGLIEKSKRDFNCPLGLMELNEKGLRRKITYINQYINAFKCIKEEFNIDDIDEKSKNNFKEIMEEEKTKIINNYNHNQTNKKNEKYKGYSSKNYKEIIESINEYNIKNQNSFPEKQYELKIDIYEKLKDKSIELILFPYLFGTHFSNSAYTSHFLTRIFPFTKTAIKIQGEDFDAPDRLFINLEKTFNSVISEKSDLRELIPEFFFFPEMFQNINHLNLGKLQDLIKNNNQWNTTVNLFKKFFKGDVSVNNVFLPFWCKNNPYLFIIIYREILEEITDINLWIDLIFGFKSNGIEAQNNCNLYSRYCYENCLSYYLKKNKNLNKEEKESLMKLCELGVNPIKIFQKKTSDKKNFNFHDVLSKIKINYFKYTNMILDKNLDDENFQLNHFYSEIIEKELSTRKKLNLNNYTYLYTGFFNGNSYIFKPLEIKCFFNLGDNNYSKLIDKSQITAFTFYEREIGNQLLILGTEKGNIKIYENVIKPKPNSLYEFIKIIHSHNKRINYMNANSTLNMLIDCSDDNYINLYSLPNLKIIKVIYNSNIYYVEKVFLSSSPIPSYITYLNNKKIYCYSINGEKLSELSIQNDFEEPLIIKADDFIDYLVYKNRRNYNNIIIRKLPFLDEIQKNQ